MKYTKKLRVYIAAPYTKGDPVENTRAAILMADVVRQWGFVPFVPHLSMLWHMVSPHDPQFWYDYDNEWLTVCDVVLRMEGESFGADNEVELARHLDIPVVYNLDELLGLEKILARQNTKN